MKNLIEVTKNFCIFIVLCSAAALCGVSFLGACLTTDRWRFVGTFTQRVKSMIFVTGDFIKWKANRLLGEPVFRLAA